MDKRKLGNTGEMLTIVGFGGIAVTNEEQPAANRLVAEAVEERGINYFDVAPSYGNAEERLGPALEPYRDSVFLACKTTERMAEGAAAEMRRSLQRLRTDHFDLYQFHSVKSMADVEQITGPGGALEAVLEARSQGLLRYVGFSAHDEDAAIALMDRFAFDTMLFPVNWVCWHQGGFGHRMLAKADGKGMGLLALKSMAKHKVPEGTERPWPKCWYAPVESYDEAKRALRFTLSRGITAAVSPGHAQFLWWMCDAAEGLSPLTPEEEKDVALRSEGLEPIFPQ